MSHDYDPCWDYPVCDLSAVETLTPSEHASIESVITKVRADLAPALGFEAPFEVFFVEPMGLSNVGTDGAVAVYCNGTSSRPIVGFDLYFMRDICTEEQLDLAQQFHQSLAHELGHAYQEACGQDHEAEDLFSEDAAETFARSWVDFAAIELWRLNPDLPRPGERSGMAG